MDILFLLLVVVCLIGLYLCFDNRQLRKGAEVQEEMLADLLTERDQLRAKLKKAEKNDYKVKGKYAKRPK